MPFIRMSDKNKDDPKKGLCVRELSSCNKVFGEVGLEIEVEGNQFKKQRIPQPWKYTHDGSLRGKDNAEYILRKPIKFSEVSESIDKLWKMFDDYGSVLDDSNRTSVHVHMNAQSWHLNRVCAFASLYFIVEDVLTHWCGDHRVGNLFCLRAVDAPGIISRLKRFFQTEATQYITGGMHYSGLNFHALLKLGSLEVRSMRGTQDPEQIKLWVSVLEHIYNLSEKYQDDLGSIVDQFSGQTRQDLFRKIVGPHADKIMDECGLNFEQFDASLLEGVRMSQSLCYCRDWSKYQKKPEFSDIFNRSRHKVNEPLLGYDESGPFNPSTSQAQGQLYHDEPANPSPSISELLEVELTPLSEAVWQASQASVNESI